MLSYDSQISSKGMLNIPEPASIPPTFKGSTCGYGDHGHPIEFETELAEVLIRETYLFISKGYDLSFEILTNLKSEVRSELFRFWVALKSYNESQRPLVPINDLVDGLRRGDEYLVFLKKLRSYHLVLSRGGRFEEKDPSMDHVVQYSRGLGPLVDIGQIFNVRYYFFWSQPDEEDWRATELPIQPIAGADLERLYTTVYSMLPEDIETIEEEEVLLAISSSMSKNGRGKSVPVWDAKQSENFFSKEPLKGYGTYIQKCPGDTRFSITLGVPQSNSVKLIEKQVALIAEEMPFSAYTNKEEIYTQRYKDFQTRYDRFYCRDIKKDGLTKPRVLLQTVCRAIKDKYPHMPACRYFSIYDGFCLVRNKVEYHPPRGIGLGMSSALTTILQSALFKIAIEEMHDENDEELPLREVGAIAYHDDIAIGAQDEYTIEAFCDAEDRVLTRYQLIKNKRKSFFANWFVLCENYSDEFLDEKDSYQRYLLMLPYASCNISHAKAQFASNLKFIHTIDYKPILNGLVAFWGYEYHCLEHERPAQWGGWVPASYMGVDISMYLREPDHYDQAAAMSYTLEKPYVGKKLERYSEKPYQPVCNQIFGHDLSFGGQEKIYKVNMTQKQVAREYVDFKSIGEKPGYWNHIYRKRQKEFQRLMLTPSLSTEEFYYHYCDKHNLADIMPPRSLFIGESVDQYEEVDRIYNPTNPFTQFLKFHNPEKLRKDIIPWPIPPGLVTNRKLQLTSEERRQLQYTPTLLRYYNLGELTIFSVPERIIPSEYWASPTTMRAATLALTGSDHLPRGIVKRDHLKHIKDIRPSVWFILSTQSVGLYKALLHRGISDPTLLVEHAATFVSDLQPFLTARRQAQDMLKAYKLADEKLDEIEVQSQSDSFNGSHHSVIGWSDTPLSDSGFFNWQYTHRCYRDWRNLFFEKIEDKLLSITAKNSADSGKHGMDYVEIEWSENDILDEVEAYFYTKSGGKLTDQGFCDIWRLAIDEESTIPSIHSDKIASNAGSQKSDSDVSIGFLDMG